MLQKMCSAIDMDQNGRITLKEFMEGFDTNEEFENLFARLDLGRRDVGVLFDLMDAEDEGKGPWVGMLGGKMSWVQISHGAGP